MCPHTPHQATCTYCVCVCVVHITHHQSSHHHTHTNNDLHTNTPPANRGDSSFKLSTQYWWLIYGNLITHANTHTHARTQTHAHIQIPIIIMYVCTYMDGVCVDSEKDSTHGMKGKDESRERRRKQYINTFMHVCVRVCVCDEMGWGRRARTQPQ